MRTSCLEGGYTSGISEEEEEQQPHALVRVVVPTLFGHVAAYGAWRCGSWTLEDLAQPMHHLFSVLVLY